jgi:hypothetical protein
MKAISAIDVIRSSQAFLGLSASSAPVVDDAYLAALVRRLAATNCPCSPRTLADSCFEAVAFLADFDALPERISAIVDRLTARGDLLELHQVVIDDPDVKASSLFPAPPSFVMRPGGIAELFGVSSDEPLPLPHTLMSRIIYGGVNRTMFPLNEEDLASTLRGLGLVEISLARWLRTPRHQTAEELLSATTQRLFDAIPSGEIAELQILDSDRDVLFYQGRWKVPHGETGRYVARRPQAYGAPLWGFVKLADGKPLQFLDFPLPNSKLRGCDTAWQLQFAIDSQRNRPQLYRARPMDEDKARFDFFSPFPAWCQRRFDLMGQLVPKDHCLFSYLVPARERAEHESFLRTHLWLASTEDSE